MKRFRLLALLILLSYGAILFNTIRSSSTMVMQQTSTLISYLENNDLEMTPLGHANVVAKEPNNASFRFQNLKTGQEVTCVPENFNFMQFSTDKEVPQFSTVNNILSYTFIFLMLFAFILIFYALVIFAKVIRRLLKEQIFEDILIKNFNKLGCSLIAIGVLESIATICNVKLASNLIELENFTITYFNTIQWNTIILGLVILMMNEIIKFAIGYKQEQDFTV